MKPTVYIETSVISYLAMRPSGHLVTAANQQITHDFWHNHRSRFDLFVSLAVIDECAGGDKEAAKERDQFLRGVAVLDVNDQVYEVADSLAEALSLPHRARVDSVHIAVSAVNGLDYLVTWNCKHIANPAMRTTIEEVCDNAGYAPPVICTPPELIEVPTYE